MIHQPIIERGAGSKKVAHDGRSAIQRVRFGRGLSAILRKSR